MMGLPVLQRDFKGIWIPKEVWLDKKLTTTEKLFLVEIDSLDNKDGCWASNKYFAGFFGITRGRVTQIIKSLEKKEKVTIELKRKGKLVERRIIRVVNKLTRGGEYSNGGWLENDEENNTKISNTKSNKRTQFIKPSLREVTEYCKGRNNEIDPQNFLDANDAKGWVVGTTKTPMKDWQAVIRTWEKNGFNKERKPKTSGRIGRALHAIAENTSNVTGSSIKRIDTDANKIAG